MNKKRTMPFVCRWTVIVLAALSVLGTGEALGQAASGAEFTQVTRPVAELRDEKQIQDLLSRLFITPRIPQDSISRIEVIDITENGYGPDDVVVIYPSGGTYMINPKMMTSQVRRIMDGWAQTSDFQYDGGAEVTAEAFRPDTTRQDTSQADTTKIESGPSTVRRAQFGMMADVLETVNRNYGGDQISLLFEKDATGFSLEMWDYSPQAMQYQAPPTGPPDTVRTRDLVYVVRSDSVVHDVVYINRTVKETRYVPRREPAAKLPEGRKKNTPFPRKEGSSDVTTTDPQKRRKK